MGDEIYKLFPSSVVCSSLDSPSLTRDLTNILSDMLAQFGNKLFVRFAADVFPSYVTADAYDTE